jgi:hypothetical protein
VQAQVYLCAGAVTCLYKDIFHLKLNKKWLTNGPKCGNAGTLWCSGVAVSEKKLSKSWPIIRANVNFIIGVSFMGVEANFILWWSFHSSNFAILSKYSSMKIS